MRIQTSLLWSTTIFHTVFTSCSKNGLNRINSLPRITIAETQLLQIQDMVLLHHEVEVEYPDGQPTEKHQATLLEFGKVENGRSTTAMALTVGVPAAIGALVVNLTTIILA